MFTCPGCKKILLEDATKCANCGYEFTQEKIDSLKRKQRNFSGFIIGLFALAGGILLLCIISLFVSEPQLSDNPETATNKTISFDQQENATLPTTKSNEVESDLTKELSCYEIGYRYGICSGSALTNSKCPPEYDFVVPTRCRNNPDTERGITDGLKELMGGRLAESTQPISKDDYIQSAKFIGTKEDDIYIKDFIKRPDYYKNQRIKINLKVMSIIEKDGNTLINVYLTPNFEQGVIVCKGSVDVYDDDIITVYGEVIGTVEGINGMGVAMSWPGILAKYVELLNK